MAASDYVLFRAGQGPTKEFQIRKEGACRYSPVIRENFYHVEKPLWKYRLEECCERSLGMFCKYLEGHTLVIPKEVVTAARDTVDMMLAELYVLAIKFDIPQLQNLVIRMVDSIARDTKKASMKWFEYVYANTAPESALRRLCLSHCAYNVSSQTIIEKQDLFPKEMMIDLLTLYKAALPNEKMREKATAGTMKDYIVKEHEIMW